MMNKPFEYWAVMVGMVLYVAARHAESEAFWRRLAKTGASAGLALGGSAEVAKYLNGSETLAVVAIMAFGLLALDIGTAIIQDRDFIKELVRKRIGGGGNE